MVSVVTADVTLALVVIEPHTKAGLPLWMELCSDLSTPWTEYVIGTSRGKVGWQPSKDTWRNDWLLSGGEELGPPGVYVCRESGVCDCSSPN